jgi:hypothetical protein
MPYFQAPSGGLHCLSAQDIVNGGESLLPAGAVSITDAAAAAILNPPLTLADAKKAQDTAVSAACQAAIIAGFSSPALGTANTYPLDPAIDQTNLHAAYLAAQEAMANAKTWAAGATASLYEVVLVNGAYFLCTTAGVTGTAAPAWPTTFQQDVTDGTAVWALAGWLLSTASGAQWHTVAQVIAVWQGYLAFVSDCRAKYRALAAQIEAAATVAAAQAVVWS